MVQGVVVGQPQEAIWSVRVERKAWLALRSGDEIPRLDCERQKEESEVVGQ